MIFFKRMLIVLCCFLFVQNSSDAKTKNNPKIFFESTGTIHHIFVKDQQVVIQGSVLPHSSFMVDSFQISFADKNYVIYCGPLKAGFFSLMLPLSLEELARLNNQLIKVTPLMGNGCYSHSLYYIYQPAIPVPSYEETVAVGHGDFIKTGFDILGLLIGRGELKRTDTVLDIGCGLGRVAYPLAYYLKPDARYEGFDVEENLVLKAQEILNPHMPYFNFQHANIYNSVYNPNGDVLSSQFRFPYADEIFDFIFLTSVFTHMLPEDICHYLSEIQRVLKPQGTCLVTSFLLENESMNLMSAGKSMFNFQYPYGDCFIVNTSYPEGAVAYEKPKFLHWISAAGLKIHQIYKGSWCGRTKNYTSFQDILILKKSSV